MQTVGRVNRNLFSHNSEIQEPRAWQGCSPRGAPQHQPLSQPSYCCPLFCLVVPSAFSSLIMLLAGSIIRDGYLKRLKNYISRGLFPDKVVYRFGLRIWLYLLEPPFSWELMPLFFILIASPIPHCQDSVSSFLVHVCHFGFILPWKSLTYIFMMVSPLENFRMCF